MTAIHVLLALRKNDLLDSSICAIFIETNLEDLVAYTIFGGNFVLGPGFQNKLDGGFFSDDQVRMEADKIDEPATRYGGQ